VTRPPGGARELADALRGRIHDERVLTAIAAVPRECFVPADRLGEAYVDRALPIGGGQTISQPTVVALMCEALELTGDERVLDVGTGSGYHAAVLAQLAAYITGVELDPRLAAGAARALAAAGIRNVSVRAGDGTAGAPDAAPFDAISVAASAPAVPPALLEQLGAGGRLVAPVRERAGERLVLVRRTSSGLERRTLGPVRFVPLRARARSRWSG
jgi:protein-L-isoaspartate(D-aspartate) O-methyltransferase